MAHAASTLPAATAVLAVYAHPDDESFGLGAVLDALARAGATVDGLCFTHGEATTLGTAADSDLHAVRAAELTGAARALGLVRCDLLGYPDGGLAGSPVDELARHVTDRARRSGADLLVVFDHGGVTGHPDHQAATDAALSAADRLDLPVLAWTVAHDVAATLNDEMGTAFRGRRPEETDLVITVDRRRQLDAIGCHRSQSGANPVLWRRLELTGDTEPLRWLRRPGGLGADLRGCSRRASPRRSRGGSG